MKLINKTALRSFSEKGSASGWGEIWSKRSQSGPSRLLLAGGSCIAETEYEKSLVSTVLKLHPKLGDKLWLKEDSEGK